MAINVVTSEFGLCGPEPRGSLIDGVTDRSTVPLVTTRPVQAVRVVACLSWLSRPFERVSALSLRGWHIVGIAAATCRRSASLMSGSLNCGIGRAAVRSRILPVAFLMWIAVLRGKNFLEPRTEVDVACDTEAVSTEQDTVDFLPIPRQQS